MSERIVYLTCAKCSNNTLRYSSTIDGLRCQHCGVAYLNCEQVEKMMIDLKEANDNLFKISRRYCIENKRLRLFLDGEVALVEQLGKYVKTQCCEGSVKEGGKQQ
jgi:DNA-directed RNA polymerase subunit RPC12/RpoP